MLRRLGLLLGLSLLLWAGQAWARGGAVWVALSSNDTSNLEAVDALRLGLKEVELDVRAWQDFPANAAAPRLIVTVGSEALNHLADLVRPAWSRVAVVALLVPRSALQKAMAAGDRRLTGIYLDQPFSRQLALLRLAAPDLGRVGVLLGPGTRRYRNEISQAAREAGLREAVATVDEVETLSPRLQSLLLESDALLSLPDETIFNAQTARHILMASYRRRVPVIGFSPAFVRAGALMAVYSTPAQIGGQAAAMVAEGLNGKLPAVQAPSDFKVAVNATVARSFALMLDEDRLTRLLGGEEAEP